MLGYQILYVIGTQLYKRECKKCHESEKKIL